MPTERATKDFRERAKTNGFPIARLIGFEAKDIANGRATVVLAAGPQHANPMGTLHGGILCDIADAGMGIAFPSTLAPDESSTTVELKINYFRPVPCRMLMCSMPTATKTKTNRSANRAANMRVPTEVFGAPSV